MGEIFAVAYEELTGSPLTGNLECSQQPPDRLFQWRGLSVGAELFELEAFYPGRAFLNDITDRIYDEFQRLESTDRYAGMMVSVVMKPIQLETVGEIKAEWAKRGIRGGHQTTARELVALVNDNVPSSEAIPEHDMIWFRVNEKDSPALAALGRIVTCTRSRVEDNRRSDRRAAPLVQLSNAFLVDRSRVTAVTAGVITQKVKTRGSWAPVDRAIIIAHEVPRYHIDWPLIQDWEQDLRAAAESVGTRDAFDELWVVTREFSRTSVVPIFRKT